MKGITLKITIDKKNLKKDPPDINGLLSKISTGQAVLFTGAGFSSSTLNVDGQDTSTATDLAHEICDLGSFPHDDDLRYVTDYYLANNNKENLVRFLRQKYTLSEVSSIHNTICGINWRRFYTTNYDKSIEIASNNNNKIVDTIDVDYPTESYYRRENLCIHLNGSIDSLNEESIDNSFKLSSSSYISPESFVDSDWFYYFKKDLERCSAIVFVGYSMYDIEIQKILFENESLKEKTYFITRESPSDKTKFILSKFGKIIPIGVNGFSKLINNNISTIESYDTDHDLKSLALYQLSHEQIDIRDADVESMIMYGNINDISVEDAVLGEQRIPFLIIREYLELVKEFIRSNKNIILYGDMGNGKSIITSQLQPYLTASSYDCYYIHDFEGDYISDIDNISKKGNKSIIILDGYDRYIDLLKHFSYSLPDNINIVATSRTSEHERLRLLLKEINFEYNELCLDKLNDREIYELVDIVDNLGMWGEKAGLSKERKADYINSKQKSHLSLTLLSLFNAPQIRDRISSELTPLLSDKESKDTIFAIALTELLDIPSKFSMISDISNNDKIYSSDFLNNKNFKNLFDNNRLEIKNKSSLFCLSLIRNHFSPSYVTSSLLEIAKRFNEYTNKDHEQKLVFKSTLRFSFIERLLSDVNKKGNLKGYYENLKVSVDWLKKDPHFWLQYGMANITFKEYPKAQQFLNQSYSLAQQRDGYHTSNIDTQQARLHLLLAMEEHEPYKIFEGFNNAHKLLDKLDNDVYKFRQVEKYRDFYSSSYNKLSNGNKVNFQRACQKMLSTIERAFQDGEIDLYQQYSVTKAKENLDFILNDIK